MPSVLPPAMVMGIIGPLPRLAEPSCVGATAGVGDGALPPSIGVGDGTSCPSSATLLGGGVPAVASPLVGVLAPTLSRVGSSSATSVVAATAGCSTGCSVAVCPATLCSAATSSVVLELKTLPGSTSEAVLQGKPNPDLLHQNSNLRKNELF